MASNFTPKLGRIGWKHGTRLDRYVNRVVHAAQAAGHGTQHSKSRFTGARIGRGSAFGTLAGAGLYPGGQRRVIVKARITKLKFGGLGAARAHLRYIQRDGVTPEGEAGELYGPETDEANGSLFLDKCEGDRHQFRLIVSADDATELADLKPFIRDLMVKVESDLGTNLDWVAVDHFNTGHPHTHIVIRGKDDRSDDLIIAKDYVSHGFRMRARELVTLELGPEIESDMTLKLSREVGANRFTRLDRALLNHTDRGFLVVSAMPPSDHQTHAAHLGRLRKLEDLGLAQERQTGVWQIADQIEPQLKSLGSRDDIIKTWNHRPECRRPAPGRRGSWC
jgi:type IV secretory pathway VirD2 relaxase